MKKLNLLKVLKVTGWIKRHFSTSRNSNTRTGDGRSMNCKKQISFGLKEPSTELEKMKTSKKLKEGLQLKLNNDGLLACMERITGAYLTYLPEEYNHFTNWL